MEDKNKIDLSLFETDAYKVPHYKTYEGLEDFVPPVLHIVERGVDEEVQYVSSAHIMSQGYDTIKRRINDE